jgi:anti-sigma B factor antagonist
MDISFKSEGDIAILKISGRLDAQSADDLKGFFAGALEKAHCFIFDCTELEFMDSTGLGALISCLKKALSKGGEIRLANINSRIRIVLEITRAKKVFGIFDSVDNAIASYKMDTNS